MISQANIRASPNLTQVTLTTRRWMPTDVGTGAARFDRVNRAYQGVRTEAPEDTLRQLFLEVFLGFWQIKKFIKEDRDSPRLTIM